MAPVATRAEASAADKTTAQALFDFGQKLIAEGKYADACPKFAESQRLDPAIGTEFYLADCLEHTGRLATAWTHYMEVASSARAAGQASRATFARAKADALKPRLPSLTVTVPEAMKLADGLLIKRDGDTVSAAQWGVPIPVDPGKHTVAVTASGKKDWTATIEVTKEGSTTTIAIPALEAPLPAEVKPPPVASEPTPALIPPRQDIPAPDQGSAKRSTQKTISVVVLGVGAAGLVVGAVTGGLALGKHSDITKSCPEGHCPPGQEANLQPTIDSYTTMGTLSTIGFIAGGALAATGVVMMLTAPKTKTTQATVTPVVGLGFIGAQGSF